MGDFGNNHNMSGSGSGSGGMKRASPPASAANSFGSLANAAITNAYKRQKTDGADGPSGLGSGEREKEKERGGSGSGGGHALDPDQLSDALHSAGVNLKEEEHLLSQSLYQDPSRVDPSGRGSGGTAGPGGTAAGLGLGPGGANLGGAIGSNLNQRPAAVVSPFLDPRLLNAIVRTLSLEMGVRYLNDKDSEILGLLSTSCEEWLSDILTSAVILSRHRRKPRNDLPRSDVSRALRAIAIKEKEQEDRRQARKAAMGLDGGDADGEKKGASEDVQHRAANATALMMTQGKKKYSWMSGGEASVGGSRANPTAMARSDNIRFRDAKEESGISLRDLLNALEQRRYGVEKALIKGYAKVKN